MLRTKAKRSDAVTALELENQALSYAAATEAIVLLKNNGLLPISPGKLALYGAGAGRTVKGGSGSGEVIERHAVSIREGLERRGFTVTSNRWLDRYDALWQTEREKFIAAMRKKLRSVSTAALAELMAAEYRYPYGDAVAADDLSDETDTCLYVLSRQSGEGRDRKEEDYQLSEAERGHLEAICRHYPKVILAVNTGASFDLSFTEDFPTIRAVVYVCQLGQEGGLALADVLTGAVNPSGKLTTTWARRYSDIPFGDEYSYRGADSMHALYKEGIYVGYRYFDSFQVPPRYEFGYGLSYTDFALSVSPVRVSGTVIGLDVSVRNTGKRFAGKETVQLYVSCPDGKLEKEAQSLAAFAKTRLLAPGESETLTLSFSMERLASYDEETASMLLEKGTYLLRVGTSSRRTEVCDALRLKETVTVSKHKNLCAAKVPVQTLHKKASDGTFVADAVELDPSAFRTKRMDYTPRKADESKQAEELLDCLGAEAQTDFCAGIGLLGGETYFTVPGAVGNTTSAYASLGVPNVAFCDGPAGIRIQRRSTVTKKGKVKPVDGAISIYEYLPGLLRKLLFGNPLKEEVVYQYVTSFPVAAALAQTWNPPLLEEIGRAVSREMSEYGVVFWLAPALNIVRNPLCGRSFEYYSEDPLLSGKMAVAITRGVQETPGNYVTVKHFAANNQEENRYYVSSEMDERTLREIYLRGFEIVVCEAKPKALMTAYNKLNGVYCPANQELIDDILRREWDYDGIVMTDWLSTGENRAQNPEVIAAGVDLIMPGGKGVCKELRKALKDGNLDAEQVRRAAGRVLTKVLDSQMEVD